MTQEYFSDNQLAERYQVSRATIWRWHKIGLLPQVIKITTGTTRWRRSDIEERDAQASQQAARTTSKATPAVQEAAQKTAQKTAKATRSRAVRPAVRTRGSSKRLA